MRLRLVLLALLLLALRPPSAAGAAAPAEAPGAGSGAEMYAAPGVPEESVRAGEGLRLVFPDDRSRSRRTLWPRADAGPPAPSAHALRRAAAGGRRVCARFLHGGRPPYYATAPPLSPR